MDENYSVDHPAIQTYMETENPIIDFDSYTEILDDYGYFKEDYYGKTPYLLKAEKVLESLMTLVKQNPLDDYTNHPLNIKLQKLLQKQFGFKDVFILWFQDSKKRRTAKTFSSVNIFSGLIDETRFKNKKDGFYDANHKLICCITLSISNMIYANINAEECIAILLHEIGHNFDYSINHAISTILGIIGSASKLVSKKSIIIGKKYDPETNTTTLYRKTVPIVDLEQAIYLAGVATPIRKTYAKFISLIDKLLNKFPFAKKVENVFGELISYYDKMYYMITSFRNLKNLPRQILLTPLSVYAQIFVIRKNEEFADSFATMYGYGPSLMTGLTKLDYTTVMNLQDTEIGNNPVVKALLDITMLESCICSFFLSGHGTDEQRIMQQIKFVKKEISNGNYPPSIKEELKNQVNELEEILMNNVEMTDEKVKLPFTIFVRRLISKIFHNDTEMISKLFPENLANISLEFAVDDMDGDLVTEAVDLTTAFKYYHGEPERQGFKPESSCRAWDKDLYSKSIDYEVLNSLGSPHVSDKDEYILHLYTLGDETHSMYIGSVNVKREGNKRLGNKSFDWEWNKQLPIDPRIVSYLREEIQTESCVTEQKTVLDPDHETKITDKSFKYIDIKSASANKYLNTDAYYKKFSEYIRNDCVGEIVVCVDDDKLAGYVIVDNKKYPGFIVPLEVMKPYRGLGLSKKLLNDAIRKYGAIDLCVDKNNEIAINLYKKFGFVIIDDEDKKNRYYMKLKSKLTKEEKDDTITESTKRSELKDSDFGLPKERKYQLDTKKHVLSAIKFFNYVSEENEEELARNINKAIDKFFDSDEKANIHVGKNNRFSKYFNVDLKESTNIESEEIDMSNLSEYTDKIGRIREIYKSIAVKRMTGELTTEAANETLSMLMEKALNASEEFIATESGLDLVRNKFKPSKIRTAKGDADGYVSNLTVGGKHIGLLAKNVTGKEEITASQLKTDAAILNKGFKQLAEDAVADLTKMAGRYKMDPKSIRRKMKLSHVEYKPTFDKAGGVKSGEFSIWYNDEKSADVNFFGGHSYVQRVTISDGKIVKASGSLAN